MDSTITKAQQQAFNPQQVKADIPLFAADQHQSLSYLDNAATTQTPKPVIDAICASYTRLNGPVARGLYPLAQQATEAYQQSRRVLQQFIGASDEREVIFTPSATDSINQLAESFLRPRIMSGQVVWVCRTAHHANYLPWLRVCQQQNATLKFIELDKHGQLNWQQIPALFSKRTALIALCHVSNVLGQVNPVSEICAAARAKGIPVLVDAAQSLGHMAVDVNKLGCDFLVASAHKMLGPNGIGLLYCRQRWLDSMQPWRLGGGMVDQVGFGADASQWSEVPSRFEAGSANLANALGFAAAARYLQDISLPLVEQHVKILSQYAYEQLSAIDGVRILSGVPGPGSSIVSFVHEQVHAHDLAQFAADFGVAIRAGHHCAQPLMQYFDISGCARASFSLYNHQQDVDKLVASVREAVEVLG